MTESTNQPLDYLTWILASRIRCGCNIQILMDYRNPVEEKGWHGHSLSERGHEGQREPLGKPNPWPQRLLLPPWAPAMGRGPDPPGPGSPQMNAFCGHQGQWATDSFTEKGVRALGGTVVEAVTLPSWVV